MAGSTAARYVRGEWTAVVTEQGTALLHPSIDEEQVRGVWTALSEGAGVSGCLEVLAAGGLAGLPSFALVQHGPGELRVLVRGEVQITAGEHAVGAAGIATWREALVPAESYRVAIDDDGAAGVAWPLSAGVVLADQIEWLGSVQDVTEAAQAGVAAAHGAPSGTDDPEQVEEPAPAAAVAADPTAAPTEGAGTASAEEPALAPEARSAEEPAAEAESAEEPEPAGDGLEEPVGVGDSPEEPVGAEDSPEEPEAGSTPDLGADQTDVSDAVAGTDEDEIEAVAEDAVQVADAAEPDPADGPEDGGAGDEPGDGGAGDEPGDAGAGAVPSDAGAAEVSEETQVGDLPDVRADVAAPPSPNTEGGEIIDSLPWAVGAAGREQAAAQEAPVQPAAGGAESVEEATPENAEPASSDPQAPVPALEEDDLPEHTVLSPRGPNAAAAAAASAPVPPWQPPVDMSRPAGPVPAYGQGDVDIDGDHDGHTVMVSELPKGQDMTIVPGLGDTDLYDEPGHAPAGTPALSLSVSTGAEVPLDRPVLIGRAPESARFSAGVQPRLVTVPSPQQDISRTHVEVRAEGGSAVVTDLNSTNGTVVVQPGTPPRRLHAGEGASVPAGTLIDLGDGVTVNVHPTDQAAR